MIDYKQKAKAFRALLEEFARVTLLMHKRPDGDTLCSALALFESLKQEKISCEVVCIDRDLPMQYKFLKGFSKIKHKIDFENSLIITLDCASSSRVGFDISSRRVVNIDHHASNTNFGLLNIVEIEVATTLVLYKLLKEGFCINRDVASAIYAGLLSDSINFTTSLVKKETFVYAAEIVSYGVDIVEVSNYVNRYNSLAHFRAKQIAMSHLELFFDAKLALSFLDEPDFRASGARVSDIDGIIDEFIALAVVEVAVLITNIDGLIKVSMRSKNLDVSQIALAFGGGGHKNAAGFEAKNSTILDIKNRLLEKIKDRI